VVAAPFVLYKRPAFLDDDAPVAMSLALVAKDLGLITDFADSLGSPAPTTQAVLAEVTEAVDAGFGDRDMATLARYLLSTS
jgi:3-hydroxyisobutyrate dehydrogenase-like beta-hydroxyacid dehydrogenase